MCEVCAVCHHNRQAVDVGRATSSSCAAQLESKLIFVQSNQRFRLSCSRLRPCPTLSQITKAVVSSGPPISPPPARCRRIAYVDFTDVPEGPTLSTVRAVSDTGQGGTIDLTVDAPKVVKFGVALCQICLHVDYFCLITVAEQHANCTAAF